jgi:hypothetical protein
VITKIVGIKDSSDYKFCDPTINQAYNIRKAFLFDSIIYAVKYDNPNVKPGPGEVRIVFDQPLIDYDDDVWNAQNSEPYEYVEDSTHYYLMLHFNFAPTCPFYIYFDGLHRTVYDEWGNPYNLTIAVEVNEEVNWKQLFSLSEEHIYPMEIEMIRPIPVIDKASTMIDVYQDGLLTATLYNLSGNKIATLLTAPATAGSNYDLNMQLGFLTNGVYTLIITLDDFLVTRTILISR